MAQQSGTQHPATPMEREAEGFTGGPGIVATKSQARGSLAGIVIGGIVGVMLGAALGALVFQGTFGLVIGAVVIGVAGLVAGGVSGGIVNPQRKLDRGEADV